MLLKTSLAILFFISYFAQMPFSYGAYGNSESESLHALSIGSGISSPSLTSSLWENPAGLIYNQQVTFLSEGGWTNSNLNSTGMGALFFLGNGSVGGGLGIQTFNGQGDNAATLTQLNFGISATITSLNIALGVSGTYFLSQTTNFSGTPSGGNFYGDVGLLYYPMGSVRIGATAFQISNGGLGAVGAGIAADASPWATFSVDASMNASNGTVTGAGVVVKPTLGIHLAELQFVGGYGINLDNAPTSWIPHGAAFGVGFSFSANSTLQFYYNQLALYYVGLQLRM